MQLSASSQLPCCVQVLSAVAAFAALSASMLHGSTENRFRLVLPPALLLLCLCLFLVALYSGGLHSHAAHAHLIAPLDTDPDLPVEPRPPPDSILEHRLSMMDIFATLRGRSPSAADAVDAGRDFVVEGSAELGESGSMAVPLLSHGVHQ